MSPDIPTGGYPDGNIPTGGFGGDIAEVIEVMMAKKTRDRYNNAEEVLTDLEAVKNGQPPVLAKRKFDMESLEQLQQGLLVNMDDDKDKFYGAETITRYRIFITILIAIIIILALFSLLLLG